MISKTGAMGNNMLSKFSAGKQCNNNTHIEYDDEYVCQNLKKANFSVANNFGEVVKKFKTTFLNN